MPPGPGRPRRSRRRKGHCPSATSSYSIRSEAGGPNCNKRQHATFDLLVSFCGTYALKNGSRGPGCAYDDAFDAAAIAFQADQHSGCQPRSPESNQVWTDADSRIVADSIFSGYDDFELGVSC